MKIALRTTMRGALLGGAVACGATIAGAVPQTPSLSDSETNDIAADAYVYAYPLVLMEVTRRVMTNVARPTERGAPINQFYHMRSVPDASFTDVVRPNADTLYSSMWFDVEKEPLIVSVPDSEARYYLLPMLDMWTDVFASPGKRTTGTRAQSFAIVGPDWKGELPQGVREIRAPTAQGWLIGRMQVNGKLDYPAAHNFQDRITAVPLSAYGEPYMPPEGNVDVGLDMSAPAEQVAKMDPQTFFEIFAQAMRKNPPHANDYPILARMHRIGIEPGSAFDFASAPPEVQAALKAAPEAAKARIDEAITRQPHRQWLGAAREPHRHLWNRLRQARRHRPLRSRRQHARGRVLSLDRRHGVQGAARQHQPLCDPLREGPAAARARVLVGERLRQAPALSRQRDRALRAG